MTVRTSELDGEKSTEDFWTEKWETWRDLCLASINNWEWAWRYEGGSREASQEVIAGIQVKYNEGLDQSSSSRGDERQSKDLANELDVKYEEKQNQGWLPGHPHATMYSNLNSYKALKLKFPWIKREDILFFAFV